jgi:hypothetical protein
MEALSFLNRKGFNLFFVDRDSNADFAVSDVYANCFKKERSCAWLVLNADVSQPLSSKPIAPGK